MDPRDPYMVWYRQITCLFINPTYTPPSTHYHPAYDVISGLAGDMGAMVDALSDALAAVPTRAQVERVRDMGIHSLQRYGHGHLVHPRDDHDPNSFHSQFDFGQSSGAGDYHLQLDFGQSSGGGHTSGSTQAEDYFIHNTAPGHTQDDSSSRQLTHPPSLDPFTTIQHYTRRPRRVRRRTKDTQDGDQLTPIHESG
ncbi:uncharacterized protein LOC110734701 [Chenopodium quinoa]|uniref:uncharacterized protein LOC110734701 n=1 Tax=Chenopodium quinoa TaxID=63459 RepID=UPI000B781A3B|nr:uncharacterized protein LOC110734701 [Chenopodium quinoa]